MVMSFFHEEYSAHGFKKFKGFLEKCFITMKSFMNNNSN